MPGAFDLANGAMGDARRSQEVPLCGSEGQRAAGVRRTCTASTVRSRAMMPFRTSRVTNVSAFSKSGYSHAEPFSQNERHRRRGQGDISSIEEMARWELSA